MLKSRRTVLRTMTGAAGLLAAGRWILAPAQKTPQPMPSPNAPSNPNAPAGMDAPEFNYLEPR